MDTKPLAPGTILRGRYTIVRYVAGGGMAWVYEISERDAQGRSRTWALKELRPDIDDAQAAKEAYTLFEQEANILEHLSHPNLPQVSDFFQEKGRSYLVMEFIHGESLQKRLEQANAPMLESQVLDWIIQICDVLSYLHSRQPPIIFRDMKPSNVMVNLSGQIKLIDFGIARTYKQGKTRDTVSMGSENYAAPEQWGEAQTDARADIYALGATMYHLLTNVPPLPAFVPGDRVSIQQYNPAVSEASIAVVNRAMASDRDKRYDTSRMMRDAALECLPRRERRRYQEPSITSIAPKESSAHWRPQPDPQAQQPQQRPALQQSRPQPRAQAPVSQLTSHQHVTESDVKYCPQCGVSSSRKARFCRACGYAYVPPLPPVLALVSDRGKQWEYPLPEGDTIIGRRGGPIPASLELSFYDPEGYVSRNHALIQARQRRYQISDLGSSNGTKLNGKPLTPRTPQPLKHDDLIELGKITLRFRVR